MKNDQNQCGRSKKLYNFIVDNIFIFEIIYPRKITFQFSIFEIQSFQKTPNGKRRIITTGWAPGYTL
jgi:hypothetical protein